MSLTFPGALTLGALLASSAALTTLDTCDGGATPIPVPTPPPGAEDLYMEADDFQCILDGTHVRHFWIRNDLGHMDEALAVAADPDGGDRYPVGTIIQAIPEEAMVKRFEGFSAATQDWEYLTLDVSESGTAIIERGSDPAIGPTGVTNPLGECQSCHEAAATWDLVCETGHGCPPIPLSEAALEAIQEADPRCP